MGPWSQEPPSSPTARTDLRKYLRNDRQVTKALRLLVALGAPPDFDGCVCLDCGRRFFLEIDHIDPVANDGPTAWWNLKPRCPECHAAETKRDREAGLLDGRKGGRREESGQPDLVEQRAPP